MNKKTLFLGVVLIMLIILAYAYQGPLKRWQNNLGKPKNILANINVDLIDKIEIVNRGETLALAKLGQRWKYDNSRDFYADEAVMAKIFAELKIAAEAQMELVSNSQERKSEFKTDGSGQEIKIYQSDKPVSDFIIGNRTGDNFYISLSGASATYSIKADLPGVFNPSEWRDLTIFSTDKTKINKIRFQYPDREFTVELKNGKWAGTLPNDFAVNKDKVGKILLVMAKLKAEKIPEQIFKNTGLEKHLIIVQATGSGVDNIIMVGEAKDGLYYAKKGDSDNLYLIVKADRDELDKTSQQLK